MTTTREQDARRRRAKPWRKWYATKEWALRRSRQLERHPWCQPCKALGKTRPAQVANHDPPHRGNRKQFFEGPLVSMCKTCHDSAEQREERQGFGLGLDQDGWPADPHHPFNRGR